ncbi:MAG: hypothetical protein NTY74_04135 [Ignavibacteriae bacterium]|nr:hypothetical protein [Ignavibacteriota bacterium]
MNNLTLIQTIQTEFSPEFNQMDRKQRDNLIFIINYSLLGKNLHSLYGNYDEVFILFADYMRKKINFRQWKSMIAPFYVLVNDKFWKGTARGWSYSSRLKETINSYKLNESYIRQNNEKNEIKINVERGIDDAKLLIELVMKGQAGIDEYNQIFNPRKEIITMAELKARKNGLIMILENVSTDKYTERSTGRLFLDSDANLQKFYTELRNRLFSGIGCYDYDIINAHYTLLREWLIKEEFDTKCYVHLNLYVNNRDEVIDALTTKFNITKWKAKEIMLALLNSGVNNDHNTVFANMSKKQIEDILSFNFIYNLKKEIADIKELVYYYRFNASINRNKVMAHLLQNLESQVLNLICTKYKDSIRLKMFDGWVSDINTSVSEIEYFINEATGFNLNFKKVSL